MSARTFFCSECGSETVESTSERGDRYCPECKTPRRENDVEVVYTECVCCGNERERSAEGQRRRSEIYNERIEDDQSEPESFLDAVAVDESAMISPEKMCVKCLEAGCSTQTAFCSHSQKTADPDECDHTMVATPYADVDYQCKTCSYTETEAEYRARQAGERDIGTDPAEECGVCEASVDEPVGYKMSLREWQYLADRFDRAFPDGDLRITMCEPCNEDLSEIDVDPMNVPRSEADANMEALRPVLDDIPLGALYLEGLHHP